MDWDYTRGEVHVSMPGYMAKALKQFQHELPRHKQDSPYKWSPPKFGEKVQYAEKGDDSPPLSKEEKKLFSK